MNRQIREHKVKEALASLEVEGLKVSDYLQSQLNEYIEGRMTHKMLLQMLDEWYLTEVVKERQGGETIAVTVAENPYRWRNFKEIKEYLKEMKNK